MGAGDGGAAGAPAPRRILVVDDHPDGAEMLRLLLELEGHEVAVAHDGPSALETASTFAPTVIILDIGLPGMDGHEVARRLRQDPAMESVRLIALTGYGQAADTQRTRDSGFDSHLVKPVHLDALKPLLE
jgi:CheY-like chemotaxis protein